jgi:hypothetical protein
VAREFNHKKQEEKMKSKLIKASIAGLLGIALGATGAFAATLITDTPGGASYSKRYIALEVYNNNIGINADNVPFFITTNASNSTGGAINFQVTNGKVNEGAGQLFVSARGSDIALTGACTTALTAGTWYLVGESSAQGVVTPVTVTTYDNNTFCARNALGGTPGGTILMPAGSILSTQHGTVNTLTNIASTTVKQAINLSINSGLNPDCSNKPLVSLAYVTNQETAGPTAVLQIIPQIIGSTYAGAFTATLDSDKSFQSFLSAYNALNPAKTLISTAIGSGFVFLPNGGAAVTLIDQQTQGINGLGTTGLFDSFVATTAVTNMSFALTSAAPELGVSIAYRGIGLVNVGNTWTRTNDGDTLAAITNGSNRPLLVANDGVTPMNPTAWTLSAFSLTVGSNNFPTCVTFNNPIVGIWTGGLEAYVPFVKTAAGYETYIKLANRYTKDAVLFVAALSGANANTANVVTSTTQLSLPSIFPTSAGTNNLLFIPKNGGQITITGQDLINNNIITGADAATGAAVKFLIRVPTQQDFAEDSANNVQANSIADPYITGVVISSTPTGQRAINLNFKLSRNGALVGN